MKRSIARPPQGIAYSSDLNGLLPLLVCLDQRLDHAIQTIQADDVRASAKTPYDGLIQPDDAEILQLLTYAPGEPRFSSPSKPFEGEMMIELRADLRISLASFTTSGWAHNEFS